MAEQLWRTDSSRLWAAVKLLYLFGLPLLLFRAGLSL